MRFLLTLSLAAALSGCSLFGDSCPSGDFQDFSNGELWACVEDANGSVFIGVKNPEDERGVVNGVVLVSDEQRADYFARLEAIEGVQIGDVLGPLPATVAEISSFQAFETVRASAFVEYVEPTSVLDPL